MLIDFHAHIYPPSFNHRRQELARRDATFAELFSNPRARLTSGPELVQAIDEARVDMAVVMGVGWTNLELAQEANTYILQACQEYRGRLVGFCSVNPAWGSHAAQEVERCARLGAKGIGELHPDTQEFDITSRDQMALLMDKARSLGLPVLIHASEPLGHLYPGKGHTTPDKLYPFIQNFPDNTIVLAHWGGGLPFYALMPEVAQALTKVYFDTAASPFLYVPRVFPMALQLVGANKILFGSDFSLLPYKRTLAQIIDSSISAEERDMLLGSNAARLLNL